MIFLNLKLLRLVVQVVSVLWMLLPFEVIIVDISDIDTPFVNGIVYNYYNEYYTPTSTTTCDSCVYSYHELYLASSRLKECLVNSYCVAPSIPQSERVEVTMYKSYSEGCYRIIEEASGGLRYSQCSSGTYTVYLKRGRHIVLMYSSNGKGWTQPYYYSHDDCWKYHSTLQISVGSSSKGSFYTCNAYAGSSSFTV